MTQPCIGIDTSILVRLITELPPGLYAYCLERLNEVKGEGLLVVASNQAIGEAFITAQLRYGISSQVARVRLSDVLTGGLVYPQNGQPVLDALNATGGAGLFDRLIADGYTQTGIDTLTLDRAMSRLDQARLLDPPAAYEPQS